STHWLFINFSIRWSAKVIAARTAVPGQDRLLIYPGNRLHASWQMPASCLKSLTAVMAGYQPLLILARPLLWWPDWSSSSRSIAANSTSRPASVEAIAGFCRPRAPKPCNRRNGAHNHLTTWTPPNLSCRPGPGSDDTGPVPEHLFKLGHT